MAEQDVQGAQRLQPEQARRRGQRVVGTGQGVEAAPAPGGDLDADGAGLAAGDEARQVMADGAGG